MKTLLKLSLIIIFFAAVAACESIDNPAPVNTIDETRTATITGIVRANLDTRNDTTEFGDFEVQFENAPAGSRVSVLIDTRDYATSTTSGTYEQLIIETTTDANGAFTVQVPALARSISAEVVAEDFVADQVLVDGDTQTRVYRFADGDVSFIENGTSFVRLEYTDLDFE